jgi:bifunctional UDP-N-acetylglucosamine pyrophosphorylase / glucosamine-1-phosphate N-acetyltransferase
MSENKRETLLKKGVRIPNPESVEIGDAVDVDRISGDGVVIYSGCKIFGASTLILQNTKIGYQGPATIENCYIGPEVHLNAGYFKEAAFLKGAKAGPGAQVREGTILEEGASVAHTVGLKQTLLFPFVTLGSLINFCDCFMAGGTSPKDHSEVGSSYIHFNYTPNQDKATPSLLGDVPRGVMLDQRPIFLGGQGGLVGPSRLTFGTVTAAGSICRKDELRPNRLILGAAGKGGCIPFTPGLSQNIARTVRNNVVYIANLMALMQWYGTVRSLFISSEFPEPLYIGLKSTLCLGISERIRQFKRYRKNLIRSSKENSGSSSLNTLHQELYDKWLELEIFFTNQSVYAGKVELRDLFLEALHQRIKRTGNDYIPVIKTLNDSDKQIGTKWLQGIVDDTLSGVSKIIPTFDINKFEVN